MTANLIETGVTYKRRLRARKVISRELPADWSDADIEHYGKSISEIHADVRVTCYHNGRIILVWRNGRVA